MRIFTFILLLLGSFVGNNFTAMAQNMRSVKGRVNVINNKGKKETLSGAVIFSPGTSFGTQSDNNGQFSLDLPDSVKYIVCSFVGYNTDTFLLKTGNINLNIDLKQEKVLKEVVIAHRQKGTEMSMISVEKTERIGKKELFKAACCNLSESFETTPSVDVAFTDAVTGYKQIMMLGLAGSYTFITRENIPDVRGLSSVTGLTFTPGTWIDGMQLSKGTGSVVNGFESMAGQINVELLKPFSGDRLILNVYQSTQGRSELNAVYRYQFTDKLATNLMFHATDQWRRYDQNGDGFMDQPLGFQLSGINRWVYSAPHDWEMQAGIKGVYVDHVGGMMDYQKGMEQIDPNPWGYTNKMQRIEEWAKIAKVFTQREATSIGLQLSAVYHDQNSVYGLNTYQATQHSYYANLIFQTYLNNTNHIIKLGSSLLSDQYDEYQTYANQQNYSRTEVVPGVFTEYAYAYKDKFNLVAGLRADYDNLFGAFVTPRLHLRYALAKNTILRASIGRAQHTANIFAENMGLMASNKHFLIQTDQSGKAYGLDPEVAWNTGVNLLQKFKLNYREGSISIDYYYTNFQNQVVVDEEYPRFVQFYNLTGPSYAHSFQIQFDYELIHHLDIRLAYRYYNVMTTYENFGLKQKPLLPANRAFMSLDYEARKGWKFSYTVQWIGSKRLFVADLHHSYGSKESEPYFQMNAQVTKSFNEKLDVYLGGENLTNFMQHGDIINASQPYSADFDASQIWGPVMGINAYLGIRYKFK